MFRQWIQSLRSHKLLTLGILIHLLFYVSALWTGWLSPLLSGPAAHYHDPGIDFFQIVRGAWSFWHGGKLTGAALAGGGRYGPIGYAVNTNVYHPLFTLVVGTPLTFLAPAASYIVWLYVKLIADFLLIGFFWRQVCGLPYGEFATFLLLANVSEYAELAAGQYHFVFNAGLLLFLLMLRKRSLIGSILTFAATLLVKPVGLLFVPALVCKRHWRLVLFALAAFVFATWPFLLSGSGGYYLTNLVKQFLHPDNPGPDQIITLNALLHYSSHWPDAIYQAIRYTILAGVLLLSTWKRTPLVKALFFSIAYFLLFYNLVYEYTWSTLAYILAVCVVFCADFQSKPARICMLLTCLPSCFLLLRLLHIDVTEGARTGFVPGTVAWRWMVVSKVLPLILLMGCVLAPEAKQVGKMVKGLAVRVVSMARKAPQEAPEGKTRARQPVA